MLIFQLKHLVTKVECSHLKVRATIFRSHARNLLNKDRDIGTDIAFLIQMNKKITSHSF